MGAPIKIGTGLFKLIQRADKDEPRRCAQPLFKYENAPTHLCASSTHPQSASDGSHRVVRGGGPADASDDVYGL